MAATRSTSGGVLRVVALQGGAAATAARATAATAATAHEARGRGWLEGFERLSGAKKAALVGTLGVGAVLASRSARSAPSGPRSTESTRSVLPEAILREMQTMDTLDVLTVFGQERDVASAQTRALFDGAISGSMPEIEPGMVTASDTEIAAFCVSRVHDLIDLVNETGVFISYFEDDAGSAGRDVAIRSRDIASKRKLQTLAGAVLDLILIEKEAQLRVPANSAPFGSTLTAQIDFLSGALGSRVVSAGADETAYQPPVPALSDLVPANLSDLNNDADYGHMATWDVRHVTDMREAFTDLRLKDRSVMQMCDDLSFWDTRSVKTMAGMFKGASWFNGKIGNWHTANVSDMSDMLSGATSFDQDISNWIIGEGTHIDGMLRESGLSTANASAVSEKWGSDNAKIAGLSALSDAARFGMRGKGLVVRRVFL
jgi:hypothetical protein